MQRVREVCDGPAGVRGRLTGFLRDDDRGSATLWNLFWLCGFGALLGIGIDTTAAMNAKARLQTVADASSHAAVMDVFPITAEAIDVALNYAQANTPKHNGVVVPTDVTLGYYDHASGRLLTEDVPYLNAVQVVAGREPSRGNALQTSLLRLVGMDHWDIGSVSTAALFADISSIDRCRKNGLFSAGEIELTSNNIITGEYCLHGEGSFKINQNNVVTCDVELSTADPSGWRGSVPTPNGQPAGCSTDYQNLSNDEMVQQVVRYRSIPTKAQLEYDTMKRILDAFVSGQLDNDPFTAIPPYITQVEVRTASSFNQSFKNKTPTPGVLFAVTCTGNERLEMSGIIRNVGIYTNCEINVKKDQQVSKIKPNKLVSGIVSGNDKKLLCDPDLDTCDGTLWAAQISLNAMNCASAISAGFEKYQTMLDTAPGRTYRDGVSVDTVAQDCAIEPGANGLWDNVFIFTTAYENGDRSQNSINFPNNMQIGRLDACTEGGGARIYAGGSVSTPSGTVIHGSHFVLLGGSKMAAKADGTFGVTMEAVGNIQYAAQGLMGGCKADEADRASDVVFTIRPIAIVN